MTHLLDRGCGRSSCVGLGLRRDSRSRCRGDSRWRKKCCEHRRELYVQKYEMERQAKGIKEERRVRGIVHDSNSHTKGMGRNQKHDIQGKARWMPRHQQSLHLRGNHQPTAVLLPETHGVLTCCEIIHQTQLVALTTIMPPGESLIGVCW